jgi:hypothetical protein
MIMPPRGRKPRTNPLIPVSNASETPTDSKPEGSQAPICGQCWPEGWPEGGDFASCVHGEWSTGGKPAPAAGEHFATSSMAETIGDWVSYPAGIAIDGVTTDGVPVTITLRPDGPALVALAENPLEKYGIKTGLPATAAAPASPFAPKPAPAPVEIDPAELDTGDDVMFMPRGG